MNLQLLKNHIYIKTPDGKLHQAHLRIREKKAESVYGVNFTRRYLYLAFRDHDTVRELYITKMEGR